MFLNFDTIGHLQCCHMNWIIFSAKRNWSLMNEKRRDLIGRCLWTVGWNRTVKATNHTKSTQQNPPITELILITIAATTYPTKLGNFQNGGFYILDNVSIRDIFFNFFSEFLIVIIVANRTLCRLIGSVIILLLDKSHSASQSSDLSVTRMITDRIGICSVILPLLMLKKIDQA